MKNTHTHHILPKHIGGTDDIDNLIELTLDEHINVHKLLYEMYGRWQDKLAYQGLAGLIEKNELVREKLIMAAKTGAKISNEKQGLGKGSRVNNIHKKYINNGKMKHNKNGCKTYILIKDNNEIVVTDLVEFCNIHKMNYKSFHKQVIERRKQHNGFRIRG